MGWVDTAKDLSIEIANVFKELVTVQAEVRAIERTVDRTREDQRDFIGQTRLDIRDLQKDFDEVRRRLTKIEGTIESVFERSMREALTQVYREELEKRGTLDGMDPKQLLADRLSVDPSGGDSSGDSGKAEA